MTGEDTPLLQKVQAAPPRQRYSHHRVRRVCSFFLSAIVIVVIVALILVAFGVPIDEALPFDAAAGWSDYLPPSSSWPKSSGLSYAELEEVLQSTPDPDQARRWSKYYTSGPHLSGTNLSQAIWTRELWQEFGVAESNVVAYDVYTNYFKDHRLALINTKHGDKIEYEAILEEDVLEEDSTSGLEARIPTFHGYSANGNVTARFVFANYGTKHDFDDLVKANVTLKGHIALVKYGRIFRGLKVKRAQELGMIGVIIYTDPGDDGEVTSDKDIETYPDGPARQPSSVQRGSVNFLSIVPGDPTTPGYPSKPDGPRADPSYAIPSIPSIPISYIDALPLLKALNGHGPLASKFNQYWQQGGLKYKGVKYNIGPSSEHIKVNLYNKVEFTTTPIWNVIGVINGSVPNEVIVLGNHRDAWIAGGAADPNSGSAALNEVIRSFGKALEKGWKPLRTIVFASWDGEEQGLLGSTEWVEDYLPWLSGSAVAYINVDVGTSGPAFGAGAAPLLDHVIFNGTKKVPSPNTTVEGQSVYDAWDKHISTLGSGSDYTAFLDFAGISSVDMGFKPTGKSPVYHYHSNYDSFDWMDKFGDPGWKYHTTIARVWGIVVAQLVEDAVIPFNATNYAIALKAYLESVEVQARKAGILAQDDLDSEKKNIFHPLHSAIDTFTRASVALDSRADDLRAALEDYRWYQRITLWGRTKVINAQYKFLERKFLYKPGLPGRTWYKHFVFAPGIWTGYAGAVLPPLVEAVNDGDEKRVKEWISLLTHKIQFAAGSIIK